MADRARSVEFKVGLFVFLGLVVLVWFVLLIGDFKLMRQGYRFNVDFGFANGIKVGAPVRVAGVDKGEVKEIVLSHDSDNKPLITISAWVDADTKIPGDSRAWVNTLGLLGEKYLEIIPGEAYDRPVPPEGTLRGEDPTSVQEVTDLTKEIALQAKDTLRSAQKVLGTLDGVLTDMHEGRG
ncbi:MAG: MlaD family protein, partial [Deltaproteobacteria bacterium]